MKSAKFVKCALGGLACLFASVALFSLGYSLPDGFMEIVLLVAIFALLGAGLVLLVRAAYVLVFGEKPPKKAAPVEFKCRMGNEMEDVGSLAENYRARYAEFFAAPGVPENSPLQQLSTQMQYQLAVLRKRRLDSMGVKLEFSADRRQDGSGRPLLRAFSFVDGKNYVAEVSENVKARRRWSKDGRTLLKRRNNSLARYSVQSAINAGEGLVSCPNCGATTTREDLLDGCDYCSSKFTVDDLGSKVGNFEFRSDYETQRMNAKEVRDNMGLWIAFTLGAVAFALCFWMIAVACLDDGASVGELLAASLLVGAAAGLSVGCLSGVAYMLVVYPLLSAGIAASYLHKSDLEKLAQMERENYERELDLRQYDPAFSMEGFLSNVQGKIEAVHFAQNAWQANAFCNGSCKLDALPCRYAKVVDMDVNAIGLTSYRRENGLQLASVDAYLELYELSGSRIRSRKEHVTCVLSRLLETNTAPASTPRIMRCDGCGASLQLLEGKFCPHCNREYKLEEHDWAIASFVAE